MTRLNRHSAQPEQGASEVEKGEEVSVAPVVASGDAPEVLELVEAAFNAVALPVAVGVVGDGHLAVAFGRDHRLHAQAGKPGAQRVGIIGTVRDGPFGADACEQGRRALDLGGLAGGEQQAQRSARRIAKQVNFGGQPASGTPQRLVFVAPFLPVAACWWAFTRLASSMT